MQQFHLLLITEHARNLKPEYGLGRLFFSKLKRSKRRNSEYTLQEKNLEQEGILKK